MLFIVDECAGPSVARFLESLSHEVYSVPDLSPGWKDYQVLQKATESRGIIVTNDKDFGELIFKKRLPHYGVILMRLKDERVPNKITVLSHFLDSYPQIIQPNDFIVLTEESYRVTKFP